MRRFEENGNSRDDQVAGEDPEAEPVDDHGCELPVVDLVLVFVALFDLVRDEAQLAEDAQQFALDIRAERLVKRAAADVVANHVVAVGVLRAVLARRVAVIAAVLAVQWYCVVNVLDIWYQA